MVTNKIQNLYIAILLLSFTFSANAQESGNILDSLAFNLEAFSNKAPFTSLYIRTSKDIYESMEDLWFKAYAVDAQRQLLTAIDQTLYVQLINEERDSVVWEEEYEIEKGIVTGHIYLDNALPDGTYWLCAYSSHSLRANASSFPDTRRIKIVRSADSLLKRKPDSLPVDSSPHTPIQFHLLPEGGFLLSGVTNRVAFKAVTKNGQPYPVSGTLFEGNRPIAHFSSAHAGMGSFLLCPQPDSAYHVRLDTPFVDSLYTLPPVKKQGMSLRLLHNGQDSLVFRVYNKGTEKQRFYFRLQARGLSQVMASGEVEDSVLLKLPLQEVANGVAEATLFDRHLLPVSERLVYIKPDKRIKLTASLSKESYGRKEKVLLHIHASDENDRPLVAQLGAVVYDRLYHIQDEPKDIQTHYLLSTQLKGAIYDPGYYFDPTKTDREQALDLLLLTQGWRSYEWNEEELKKTYADSVFILPENTVGHLVPLRKKTDSPQQGVMLFDAEQQHSQLVPLDSLGNFAFSPDNLRLARRIYIKHFGGQHDFDLHVDDPFMPINRIRPWTKISYPLKKTMATNGESDEQASSRLTHGSIKLDEVTINGTKENVLRDKYMGHLDSLAKYQNNTDRVHGGWLNCPAGDGNELPKEGVTYTVWTGPNPPGAHPFSFDATNTKQVVYHYPKYTEEELLKMFGLARAKGYYPKKKFYQPDYDREKNQLPDYRNTLLWEPDMITDQNGDADLEFFSSDINTAFYGLVEGISENGIVGKSVFEFVVNK